MNHTINFSDSLLWPLRFIQIHLEILGFYREGKLHASTMTLTSIACLSIGGTASIFLFFLSGSWPLTAHLIITVMAWLFGIPLFPNACRIVMDKRGIALHLINACLLAIFWGTTLSWLYVPILLYAH